MLEINSYGILGEVIFFDESQARSYYYDPFIGSSVELSRNLDWSFDFSNWARKGLFQAFPSIKFNWNGSFKAIKQYEYKADWYLAALNYYPYRNKVLDEIYKTQIYFVDPFYFLREMDNFEILLRKDGSIEFLYDGNKHIITQSNSFYRTVEEFTLSAIQAYFAFNHPFQRIKGHIQLLSNYFGNIFETDTLPGAKAISISHLNRNGMATIANHALSALLAFPAFLDFFNEENTSPTFSNPYYDSREILNTEFSRIIGTQTPSKKSVVYDNGHSKAVDEIIEFQNQLAREISQLDHPISNRNLIQMKSESVERIQAADFVAGVARDVFKWRGKKILKSKFPRLIE